MTAAAMAGARLVSRRRIFAGLVAGSSAPAVTACGLGSGPPAHQFTLIPVPSFLRGLPPVKWSLVVDEPTAAQQLDTSRIALMSG